MRFEDWKKALIGQWQGTTRLYLEPPPAAGVVSESRLTVAPIAGGNFLQLNYDWSHESEAQSGVLIVGYEEADAASAAWVDSFHMSARIMFCTGSVAEGAATLTGSYAAPPGPDWGWRIALKLVAADELQIVMHNIWPEGKEDLAVQADYKRRR